MPIQGGGGMNESENTSKMGQKLGSENRKEGGKILTQKRQAEKGEKVIQLGSEQAPRQFEVENVMRSEKKWGGVSLTWGAKSNCQTHPWPENFIVS